jgi:hypothetical protein
MPALFTHYKFGLDVYNNLSQKIKDDIMPSMPYYNMFNQGFDNLYYYPIKWKYYRDFGIRAHKKKVAEFFTNLINYIIEHNLEDNTEITTMLYGLINHYTLDTIVHPFINAQVEILGISHTKIEFTLDSQIANNYDTKIYNTIIPRLKFNKELTNLIEEVFYQTYNEKNIGKIFNRSHNNDYYVYRYFVNDKRGHKKNFYKLVDKIFRLKDFRLQDNTFYVDKFDERILNKGKNEWHHPKNNNEIYNYSYNELYNISLKISIKLHKIAYDVLHNNKNTNELVEKIKLINLKSIQELL